jgi:ankyrin repeat protein
MDDWGTALHECAWRPNSHHLELAKLLLERGADPNLLTRDGKTVLAVALERNNHEMAELLRRYGAKE